MTWYGLENRAARDMFITYVVVGVLSLLSLIARFWCRHVKGVQPSLDDYLVLLAMATICVSVALVTMMATKGGVGRNYTDIHPPSAAQLTLKLLIPCQALYGIQLGMIKTSLMVLYLRIFGKVGNIRFVIAVVMAIVWGWAFSVVIEGFLLCRPLAFNWDQTLPNGKCGDRNAAFVAAGALNMITDVMVLVLPIPYIWSLQVPSSRKFGLCLIFCLGLFIVSIIRMNALVKLDLSDVTKNIPDVLMWSVVEPELALIGANLPLLRPLFAKVFDQFASTRDKSYSRPSALSNKHRFGSLSNRGWYAMGAVKKDVDQTQDDLRSLESSVGIVSHSAKANGSHSDV